jgi:mRNA interferase MazF
MKRGEIYWAKFSPRSGSEQKGLRPAILVSHDLFNAAKQWNSLLVVPISTSVKQFQRNSSTTVVLLPKSIGLSQDSYALCHQVTVLDRSKVQDHITTLTPSLLKDVEEAMMFALGIELSEEN